jgi:rRNA maturation endonuclease Nob1
MIQLSLPHLILVPLFFALVALSLCGLYYATWRSSPPVKTSRARIYRCAVCHHVYVDSRDVPLARCPRCGCLNEAVKR